MTLLPEVTVDRTTGEAVQDHATEKLGIRPLDLFRLERDVAREPDGELNGAGLPHA